MSTNEVISKEVVFEDLEERLQGYPVIIEIVRCFCLGFTSSFTKTFGTWMKDNWEINLLPRLQQGMPDQVALDQIHRFVNDCAVFKLNTPLNRDEHLAYVYTKPSYVVHKDVDGDEWKLSCKKTSLEEVFDLIETVVSTPAPVTERKDLLVLMPADGRVRAMCCVVNQQLILERFNLTPDDYEGVRNIESSDNHSGRVLH